MWQKSDLISPLGSFPKGEATIFAIGVDDVASPLEKLAEGLMRSLFHNL